MTTRETVQNSYWRGGEIGGVTFHPLNLERQSLLQSVWAKLEASEASPTAGDQILVAMAIYQMSNEEAENVDPDFEFLRVRATERGLGKLSLAAGEEFAAGFHLDLASMMASGTKLAGE